MIFHDGHRWGYESRVKPVAIRRAVFHTFERWGVDRAVLPDDPAFVEGAQLHQQAL